MDPDEQKALSFAELLEETDGNAPLAESATRVIVPKRGKVIAEDGTMRVSIIRPCVSRGRRLGRAKLPPIYTPQMLQANAGVFTGWPMYEDHLMEQAVEDLKEELLEMGGVDLLGSLQEAARKIREIGGRVVESRWNPDIKFHDDEQFGYQPGGIEGLVIPQEGPAKMVERDPEVLNVSINAYPTGAKLGYAPWDSSQRGMLIEGIRRAPMGSVDWVFRGGAGGRPLLIESAEERRHAVALLESAYSFGDDANPNPKGPDAVKLKDCKTREELESYLKENDGEHLISVLPAGKVTEGDAGGSGGGGGSVSLEDVQRMLRENNEGLLEQLTEKLEESSEAAEDRAERVIRERREQDELQEVAHDLIAKAEKGGLPAPFAKRLREDYRVTKDGPTPKLQVEEVKGDKPRSRAQVVEAAVRADVDGFIEVLREQGSEPKIEGFGPVVESEGDDDENGKGKSKGGGSGKSAETAAQRNSAFREQMRESGALGETKPEDESKAIREMFQED